MNNIPAYTLVIGQKNYSSWSMRAWLLMRFLGLDFETVEIGLYTDGSRARVRDLGGEAGLVPVLLIDQFAIWETLAIFEWLHERHGAVWPMDPWMRARARSLCGEVSAGMQALRAAMPCNVRARERRAIRTRETDEDIARVCDIWSSRPGGECPWLFAEFGAADIMFAPIATRFRTYGVEVEGTARAYWQRLLAHPLVEEWSGLAALETDVIPSAEVGER